MKKHRLLVTAWFVLAALVPAPAGAMPHQEVSAQAWHQAFQDDFVRDVPAPQVRSLGQKTLQGGGEAVVYRGFMQVDIPLTRFSGRYVAVLLPSTWTTALSEREIWTMVDLVDRTYANLLDIVGRPPDEPYQITGGNGLQTVAFVTPAQSFCPPPAWGCGRLGAQGVEINDVSGWMNDRIFAEIRAGETIYVILHEMVHNFDVFWEEIGYTYDHPHSWTSYLEFYAPYYAHEKVIGRPFDVGTAIWLERFDTYLDEPTATWQNCVVNDACHAQDIFPNATWGGRLLRHSMLEGRAATRAFFGRLRAFQETNPMPSTPVEKEDWVWRAWAQATQRNPACLADGWRWGISSALRSELTTTYGNANALCDDADHDGVAVYAGDCDDANGTVRPGASEVVDGRDNDCNLFVDEMRFAEPAGTDTPDVPLITFPSIVTGALHSMADRDFFDLQLVAATAVVVETCSEDTTGAIGSVIALGRPNVDSATLYPPGCERLTMALPAGVTRIEVSPTQVSSSRPGTYEVRFVPEDASWDFRPWGTVTAQAQSGGGHVLKATDHGLATTNQPDTVRFWMTGVGIAADVPYSPNATYSWTGSDATGRGIRGQLLRGGVPVSPYTSLSLIAGDTGIFASGFEP